MRGGVRRRQWCRAGISTHAEYGGAVTSPQMTPRTARMLTRAGWADATRAHHLPNLTPQPHLHAHLQLHDECREELGRASLESLHTLDHLAIEVHLNFHLDVARQLPPRGKDQPSDGETNHPPRCSNMCPLSDSHRGMRPPLQHYFACGTRSIARRLPAHN